MTINHNTIIIGAGPYGMSISAHLQPKRLGHGIIGIPMESWILGMPRGMHLKSDGAASNIYSPDGQFTLKEFCHATGHAYQDYGLPIPLELFIEYGKAFQRKLCPQVEGATLVNLRHGQGRFRLEFSNRDSMTAQRVILAVGVTDFRYIPETLSHLPSHLMTHSSQYGDIDTLRGRRVLVIGGGSSAIDIAGLLARTESDVHLLSRQAGLQIHTQGKFPRRPLERIRRPMTGIGPGWRSLVYTKAPDLFRYLPKEFRLNQAEHFPGPAAGWFMNKYVHNVHLHLRCKLLAAQVTSDHSVKVTFERDGKDEELECEHIVAGTGYKVRVDHMPFLSDQLRAAIKVIDGTPVLSTGFESSVRGLYFVGPASVGSFGPLGRFAVGAKFTAARVAKHLSEER